MKKMYTATILDFTVYDSEINGTSIAAALIGPSKLNSYTVWREVTLSHNISQHFIPLEISLFYSGINNMFNDYRRSLKQQYAGKGFLRD